MNHLSPWQDIAFTSQPIKNLHLHGLWLNVELPVWIHQKFVIVDKDHLDHETTPEIAVPASTYLNHHQKPLSFPHTQRTCPSSNSSFSKPTSYGQQGNIQWSIFDLLQFKQFLLMICYVPRTLTSAEYSVVTVLQCFWPSELYVLTGSWDKAGYCMVSARPVWWWPRELLYLSLTTPGSS